MTDPELVYLPPHEMEQFEDPCPGDPHGEWADLMAAEDRQEPWEPWWTKDDGVPPGWRR